MLLLLSLVQIVLSDAQAVSSTVSFWHITDVHVDPYYVVGAKVNVQYYIRHLFLRCAADQNVTAVSDMCAPSTIQC